MRCAAAVQAVAHFVGGAFAGAAPQLTYRLLMETLANNNLLVRAGQRADMSLEPPRCPMEPRYTGTRQMCSTTPERSNRSLRCNTAFQACLLMGGTKFLTHPPLQVIATPYSTGFDRTRIADEVQFKFDRCLRALAAGAGGSPPAVSASLPELPVFGVGHSLGCLVHLLICSRYAVQRAGNCFLSYNDKPLEDIPFLAPAISPGARMLGPILSQARHPPGRFVF